MAVAEFTGVRLRDVRAVEDPLRELVDALDPNRVVGQDAPALWAAFDAVERLAASAKTLLARRVEDANTWKRLGFRSAAEQLAGVSGTSVTSARAMLETSKRVELLPATAGALRAGKLSVAKADAIASAASIAPDAEGRLLEVAERSPLAEVREECLRARASVDRDAAYERIRRERCVREYTDGEGAWNLRARGTPDAGAVVRAALDPIVDRIFKETREEDRESRDAYAFDALVELCERAVGASVGSGDGAASAARTATRPKFLGLIRADLEALQRGSVEGGEVCEISGLGPIPVDVARRLLGDAVLKLVITKGVDVANVTHLGRSATVAQKAALWWRSPACDVEGCTRTQRLEADHRRDWVKTHWTRLDGLDRLCEHHHDLKTHAGWALVTGTRSRPMVPPEDSRHPRNRPPPDP